MDNGTKKIKRKGVRRYMYKTEKVSLEEKSATELLQKKITKMASKLEGKT